MNQIREYKIKNKIGEGGMGEVYLAEDENLGRQVAIKMLAPELMRNAELVERFKQEARLQASLIHPNIVALYTFFMHENMLYMVMEYAQGITLKEVIKQKGKLDESTAKHLMLQILEGVGFAHQLGIVHRDLKPSNIMVSKDGKIKIMDFGIAKVLGDRGMTKTGTKMGTLCYMSPEQVKAEKDIDQRTDIYSLGIIYYEMLTGKVPFNTDTESDFEVMSQIVHGDLSNVLNKYDIEQKTSAIITKMTKNQKIERYVTCYNCTEEIKGNGYIKQNEPVIKIKEIAIEKEEEKSNIIQPEMIYVEGGSFTRYSYNSFGFGKKEHVITLDSFYIGKYPITQKEWTSIMGNNPSHFKGDNLPIENVSWDDAQQFIKKLNQKTGKNYRLPTEAEWEYAARGGNKSKGYTYAGSNNIDEVAWYSSNSNNKTHEVGTKRPNELGIYDMSGNVWEWCNDWYDENYYRNSPSNNPKGPGSGTYRVLRGGSWDFNDYGSRSVDRDRYNPNNWSDYVAFRLVQD